MNEEELRHASESENEGNSESVTMELKKECVDILFR